MTDLFAILDCNPLRRQPCSFGKRDSFSELTAVNGDEYLANRVTCTFKRFPHNDFVWSSAAERDIATVNT